MQPAETVATQGYADIVMLGDEFIEALLGNRFGVTVNEANAHRTLVRSPAPTLPPRRLRVNEAEVDSTTSTACAYVSRLGALLKQPVSPPLTPL